MGFGAMARAAITGYVGANQERTRTWRRPMKLEGIRVLDLSRFLPGPHLAMMTADNVVYGSP